MFAQNLVLSMKAVVRAVPESRYENYALTHDHAQLSRPKPYTLDGLSKVRGMSNVGSLIIRIGFWGTLILIDVINYRNPKTV